MHHQRVRRGRRHPLRGQLVAPRVLRLRGQQRAAHPLALDAQRHHRVRAHNRPIQVRIARDLRQRQRMLPLLPAPRQPCGQQRARRDQRHLRAQPRQRPQIRARHPRVQHIAHDHHPPPVQPPERRVQNVGVEQRLRRMRVLPVARVDHMRTNRLRHEVRRARRRMPNDHHIRAYRRNRLHRIDQRLALLDARTARADVDHVRAQHLAGQLKRRPRARARLVEEVADRHPAQGRRARHGTPQDFPHRVGRLQHPLDFVALQGVHIEQMAMPPRLRVGGHRRRPLLRRRKRTLGKLLCHHAQRPPSPDISLASSPDSSSGAGCSDASSTPSTSLSRTRTSSPRRVGKFLPT